MSLIITFEVKPSNCNNVQLINILEDGGENDYITNWAKKIVTKSKKANVGLKSDWTRIALHQWIVSVVGVYIIPDMFQNCHFKIKSLTEHLFTMPKDLYVGCHYFLSSYHLLPFGSSEMHVFVYVFFIQTFCFVHSTIHFDSFHHFHQNSIHVHYWCPTFNPLLIFILIHIFIFIPAFMFISAFMFPFNFISVTNSFQSHHLFVSSFLNLFISSFIFTFLYKFELLLKE